ncbi:MAG: gamma-glutamylcyclotransferase family protein [Natronospirillum sp.]
MQHWIFGYGSLICADSRARTGLTGTSLPVVIRGYERHWSVPLDYADLSVLGIQRGTADQEVGGVLFALDNDAFTQFDAREVEYQRISLDPSAIAPLHDQALPDGAFWLYMPEPTDSPHPIPQSYLDVILRGCLTIDEHFAQHFLQHTTRWKPRVLDRDKPLYPRPLRPEHQHVWPTIDRLMAKI